MWLFAQVVIGTEPKDARGHKTRKWSRYVPIITAVLACDETDWAVLGSASATSALFLRSTYLLAVLLGDPIPRDKSADYTHPHSKKTIRIHSRRARRGQLYKQGGESSVKLLGALIEVIWNQQCLSHCIRSFEA